MENWYPDAVVPADLWSRIQAKKSWLDGLRPFPVSALQRLKEDLSIEWTYNSNSIEGNTLSLRETRIVLQDGLTVGGKTMREHFEAHNHHKAIQWLEDSIAGNHVLSAADILTLHRYVMSSIDEEFCGRFRNGRVRITGANFIPPNPLKVPEMVDELVNWVHENPMKLDVVSLAAAFHHRLVWIHPFFDGNGLTARLVMNVLMMKEGFPPIIILRADRSKYYDALNKANQGNFSKLMLLFAQAAERSLDIYLSALGSYPDEFLPLSDIVNEPEVPYGQEYLSLLARTGKLEAFKEGRVWYSSKAAVKRYLGDYSDNEA